MSRTHWIMMEKGQTGTKRESLPRIAKALEFEDDDPRFEELYRRAGFMPPESPPRPAPEITYERFDDDLPPDLRRVESLRERTVKGVASMPPGPEKDKAIEVLRRSAENEQATLGLVLSEDAKRLLGL